MDTAKVISCLSAGNTEQAKAIAQQYLSDDPHDPDSQYVLGLCELMTENIEAAIKWLEQARQQGKKDAACVTNLGVAYLKDHQFQAAEFCFLEVLKQNPKASLARYNLGTLYIEDHKAQAAVTEFDTLVAQHPDNTQYLCALADAKRESGHFEAAIALYDKVLARDPAYESALTNAVKLHINGGMLNKAVEICEAALATEPKCFHALQYLGDCLVAREDYEAAMTAYADAYDIHQHNSDLCCAIGNLWLRAQELMEAASWFDGAIKLDPNNLAAHCGLIHIIKETGDIDAAMERLKPLLETHPENDHILMTAADLHWEDGDAEAAIKHLTVLKNLNPHKVPVLLKMGQILASSGQVEKAVENFHSVLEKFPYSVPALCGLATGQKEKTEARFIERVHHLLAAPNLLDAAKSQLNFGLAQYYDGVKDHEQAARFSKIANESQWRNNSKIRWRYDPEEFADHITCLMEVFNAEYFKRLEQDQVGIQDETPVFIVAMPRSGTTLTEQILARHSHVLGIGERPFIARSFNAYCDQAADHDSSQERIASAFAAVDPQVIARFSGLYLEQLNRLKEKSNKPEAIRIVDKMPDNYSLIGWILTLFPKAKIIHCHRDPRDVALSCWMTQFAAIPWANNIDHLVGRIEQYQRIMSHWRQVIPERFIEIQYGDLVNDQETESKSLVSHLGFTWEPQCLKFYESDRLVRTASITQVRQPIYTKSLQKWRRYQDYLPDLFSRISPTLHAP